ncbi:protein tyrosine phosphatase-like domain-containing protein [Aspergillus lucknowensis]|uniref:Very-long-chain (3R)-3-hydroxyacyl-CoA dehydratase n=1 Tax=Aspergillus lucknowensis TaxID=176173 RepID=A0ABR4M211_9EURO
MASNTQPTPAKPKPALSGVVRQYLLAYNAANFFLWSTLTIRTLRLLINQSITDGLTFDIPAIFGETYTPMLQTAQSLAVLEILHSLIGIVRAPLLTTAMQVASRLFVVWGILYPFHSGIFGVGDKVGESAYLGCLLAWGVTECIRYGYFVMQVNGGAASVPSWWNWLRYNTFYVLYPIGISSECTLAVKALPNAEGLHPLYWWFIVAVLTIYVPGSYMLYTHMIRQRRKSSNAKKE